MARGWNEAADVERLEDVVHASRTSWARVWESWKPRGSIGSVVETYMRKETGKQTMK